MTEIGADKDTQVPLPVKCRSLSTGEWPLLGAAKLKLFVYVNAKVHELSTPQGTL